MLIIPYIHLIKREKRRASDRFTVLALLAPLTGHYSNHLVEQLKVLCSLAFA